MLQSFTSKLYACAAVKSPKLIDSSIEAVSSRGLAPLLRDGLLVMMGLESATNQGRCVRETQ